MAQLTEEGGPSKDWAASRTVFEDRRNRGEERWKPLIKRHCVESVKEGMEAVTLGPGELELC